ncbi:MAG: hypothetical protein WDO13_02685 [Verrucomicrobiota bacterium]
MKEGLIQGTLVASFTCEEFSLRRLETLTPARDRGAAQGLRLLHCLARGRC